MDCLNKKIVTEVMLLQRTIDQLDHKIDNLLAVSRKVDQLAYNIDQMDLKIHRLIEDRILDQEFDRLESADQLLPVLQAIKIIAQKMNNQDVRSYLIHTLDQCIDLLMNN